MHLILKIGISRDTECVNTVGFPKLGHIYQWMHSKLTGHFTSYLHSYSTAIGTFFGLQAQRK